jgi:hypothetical protein
MRTYLYLILNIIAPYVALGQFDKLVASGKSFKHFKPPLVDARIYNRLEEDDAIIYIGCYFTTDTAGKIVSSNFIPFNGVGNKFSSSDSIWSSVVASLSKACKEWIFKPVLWELNDKAAEVQLNKKAFQRPFNGKPNYFIIYEMSGIKGSVIQKISFENNFKVEARK